MNNCETCRCNKVCDHNRFGYENCENYIPEVSVSESEREKLAELLEDLGVTVNVPVNVDEDGCGTYEIEGGEYVADYLISNGAVLPPFKEGDTAYVICLGNVEEYTICKSPYSREEATFHLPVEEGEGHICVFSVSWKDIGKTVFLSREDAEKALETLRQPQTKLATTESTTKLTTKKGGEG